MSLYCRSVAVSKLAIFIFLFQVSHLAICNIREKISLDGEWQNAPSADIKNRPQKWKTLRVPDLRMHQRKHPSEWYETEFQLESLKENYKYYLSFGQVNHVAHIYINDQKVTSHIGGYTPFKVDITKYLTLGKNRLRVIAENVQALTLKSIRSNANLPPEERSDITVAVQIPENERICPVSPQGNIMRNWGITGHVQLEAIPDVHINDIYVKPFLKTNRLDLDVELENTSAHPFHGILKGCIGSREKEIEQLKSIPVSLAPGEIKAFCFSGISAKKLDKWWPKAFRPSSIGNKEPALYEAKITLESSPRNMDSLEQIFGYRQLWIENERFVLNGVPITLMGTSAHFGEGGLDPKIFYDKVEASGANIVRLHYQPRNDEWYELADKRGILVTAESAIGLVNGVSSTNPVFWANCQKHLNGFIKALRNHPSIVLWSIENEMGLDGKGKVTDAEVRKLYRHALTLDNTRLFEAEGDTDLDVLPIINVHCWWDYQKEMYPACFFWYEKSTFLRNYRNVKNVSFKDKPLFIGEFSTDFHDSPEDHRGETAIIKGDKAYNMNRNERFKLRGEITKKQIESYRWQGIAGMSPFTIFETKTPIPGPYSDEIKKGFRQIALLMRENDGHFYSGTQVKRTIKVINDSADYQNLNLSWQAVAKGGKVICQDERKIKLNPGENSKFKISFQAPEVKRKEDICFNLKLKKSSRVIDQISRTYKIFSRIIPCLKPTDIKIVCYQASENMLTKIKSIYPNAVSVPDIRKEMLQKNMILLIAPDSAMKITAPEKILIDDFVESGGVVVCFKQQVSLRQNLFPASEKKHSINFISDYSHPIWNYDFLLDNNDLRYWKQGFVLKKMFRKPSRGNFRILTSGGFDLEYSSLVELLDGKGVWLACQLPLIKECDNEPIARELLYRIIKYALECKNKSKKISLVGVYSKNPLLLEFINDREYKRTLELEESKLKGLNVLLTTGDDLKLLPESGKMLLANFSRAGGTIYINGLSPSVAKQIPSLFPNAEWKTYEKNQVAVSEKSWLVNGLTAADFYWCSDYFKVRNTSRRIGKITAAFKNANALTNPPLLSVIPNGKGNIIVDQILWLETDTAKGERIGNTLLNNLGVPFKKIDIDSLRNKFFYVNIDNFVNRTFHDLRPNDGDEGWTDQGNNDLRNFHTGEQVLCNIPFSVSSKKKGMAIILGGPKKISKKWAKKAVGLPINKKAKAIYFLHGAAWAWPTLKDGWEYIVNYKDGTKAVIKAENNVNFLDWWKEPKHLKGGMNAWTGSNPANNILSLYVQKWANPKPQMEIKDIDIINNGRIVSFTLAITGEVNAD